jgi:hypothetical protein
LRTFSKIILDMYYLSSYRPIIYNRQGRLAVEIFNISPFVDSSCRREPDLEASYPSITAVCRSGIFVPRLHPGDTVSYITVKGDYGRTGTHHWRLVSILTIIERFESHQEAALWYHARGLMLPSNCLMDGNPPLPYEKTSGPKPKNRFGDDENKTRIIRRWDAAYKLRVKSCGIFLICEPQFIDVYNPPILSKKDMIGIFGKTPSTRNPPGITENEYIHLFEHVHNRKY